MTVGADESVKPRLSIVWFFIILFAVSWVGTIPMVMHSYGQKISTPVRLLQILMLFGQGLVAVFYEGINDGKPGVKRLFGRLLRWRVGIQWYAFALLGPAVLAILVRLISAMFGVTLPALKPAGPLLIAFLSTFVVYLLLNTEELAWRGVALPRLQTRLGPIKASWIIGVLWGLFHIPIFLMKGGHPAGFPFWIYIVMVFSMTFIFTWVFNQTNGSVLIAHLLHQSINSWTETIPSYPRAVAGNLIPVILTVTIFALVALLVSWRSGIDRRHARTIHESLPKG